MGEDAEPTDRSGGDGAIDARYLRSALEFAVLVAREGPKLKPPLAVPDGLRRFTKQDRLSGAALNGVRRVLDTDDEFRSRIAVGATDDLVDEVGRLWLQRPAGWEDEIVVAVRRLDKQAADADLARQLKRADKRREAAERVAARSVAELAERDSRLATLASELAELTERVDVLDAERREALDQLASAKMEARHARDREQAAVERERTANERARTATDELAELAAAAERPDNAASRSSPSEAGPVAISVDPGVLDRLRGAATDLAADLAAIAASAPTAAGGGDPRAAANCRDGADRPVVGVPSARRSGGEPSHRRRPLRMPPGVLGASRDGVRFLFRSGIPVLVDGYNVTKLAWGQLALDAQRDRLVTALELLSRRYGTEITVVFDGADAVGSTGARHTGVRIVFSSASESADDWIREETRRIVAHNHVVVVTNDREIIDAVVAVGANHVTSEQLIDLLDR